MRKSDLKFMPQFFDRYINQVSDDIDLISGLNGTLNLFEELKGKLLEFQDYRYAPEKWTPKDILQHVIDNERIQAYRSLVFSRGDEVILPGYDEQLYAFNSNANSRTIEDLLLEFQLIRKATIALFQSMKEEQMHLNGICFKVEVTPLALGFQMIGHQVHHMSVLKERYFIG